MDSSGSLLQSITRELSSLLFPAELLEPLQSEATNLRISRHSHFEAAVTLEMLGPTFRTPVTTIIVNSSELLLGLITAIRNVESSFSAVQIKDLTADEDKEESGGTITDEET